MASAASKSRRVATRIAEEDNMRGDANTKRFKTLGLVGLALALAPALTVPLSGCGLDDDQSQHVVQQDGRLAVSWTLNGAPLDAATCQAQRITSMHVLVASRQNPNNNVEFLNVTCQLDRYSMAMLPYG